MLVRVKKLHPDAKFPTRATAGAAAFDLYAAYCADTSQEPCMFHEGDSFTFATGLAFEIQPGYAMFIYSRSGHGFKHDIRLSNCVGVIDSDYRGEVMVKLIRDYSDASRRGPTIARGDRIAQAVIMPIPDVQFIEAWDLTDTERGAGGFGSTGVR